MAVVTSPFFPQNLNSKPVVINEPDIVSYVRKQVLVSADPDDPEKFVTKEIVVESDRIDRQAYIESFADEVGIQNILKKVAMTNDPSYFNQIKRSALPIDSEDANGREIVQDVTALADGEQSAAQLGDQMRILFKALPADLVAGRSLEEFVNSCTTAEVETYLANLNKKPEGGAQ